MQTIKRKNFLSSATEIYELITLKPSAIFGIKLNTAAITIVATILMAPSCQNAPKKLSDTPKPNIVYILADDLGYGDLSCYGQTKFATPNIDNLAKSGIKFTQHYSGSTVCAPSRSSLMTGLHTGHTC
ncbi:MAG: sulfatase-like hydrolase/transferase, partial [Prolixibacteraceae bacterium]|nr:sulfatase-like hydrolase/transferase [Prolixibacteraceae bacterium]